MILSIYGYGEPVLRKVATDITPEYPNLKETIANMYETMYHAYGLGLAAPQVGLPIRLFILVILFAMSSNLLFKEANMSVLHFSNNFVMSASVMLFCGLEFDLVLRPDGV